MRDVAPLADAAHRHDRFVAVALVNRIAGVIEALGDCGRIAHVYFRIINGHPRRYRDWGVPWMLDPQQSGGGALRNLGVHCVDAFLALAGEQAVRVEHAAFHSIFGEPVEDYAAVTLRAADGMVGLIEAGYTHPDAGGTYEFRINAERGALVDTGTRLIAVPDRATGRTSLCAVQPTIQRLRGRYAGTPGSGPAAGRFAEGIRARDRTDRSGLPPLIGICPIFLPII